MLSGGNVATDRLGELLAAPPDGPRPDALGPAQPPAAPPAQPPPPPVPGAAPGFVYVLQPAPPVLPPVSEAVLKIPLGTRDLIRQALDLLTRSDSGLRGPSFYIGFLLLVTFGPFAVILGLALTTGAMDQTGAPSPEFPVWALWLLLSIIPALLGYIAAQAEAAGMATAVIGGRVEGNPLRDAPVDRDRPAAVLVDPRSAAPRQRHLRRHRGRDDPDPVRDLRLRGRRRHRHRRRRWSSR